MIDACWHSSLPSPFRAYPKENPVLLGLEYLNWLFTVQEFLFRQFIPSIHSVLI
nr:Ycf15 [Ilex yunnanensis]